MSTYVMSDIHGHYDEFKRMLDMIQFTDTDRLVIAGDCIDRGSQNLEMFMWIERCPANVILLKGNHEYEFAEYIRIMTDYQKKLGIPGDGLSDTLLLLQKMNWDPNLKRICVHFDFYSTIRTLIREYAVTMTELKRWAGIIRNLPLYHKLVVNGKKYIAVHAGYYIDESLKREEIEIFYLYGRDEVLDWKVLDTTVIAGHTPTIIKSMPMYADGKVYRYHDEDTNYTFYDIDCGCGYVGDNKFPNATLACIRLEDEEVFYV